MSPNSKDELYPLARAGRVAARLRYAGARALLAGLVLALAGAFLLRPDLTHNGLQAVYSTGAAGVERVALVSANDISAAPDSSFSVRWTGYLYLPGAREVIFRIPEGVQASLTIDDQTVFDRSLSDQTSSDRAAVRLSPGPHPLAFEITTPEGIGAYYQAGLEWQTLVGWRLVPGAVLYPDVPDPIAALRVLARARWSGLLAGAAALCGLALGIWRAWAYRRLLVSRTALGLALLVLLALGLRLLCLRDLTSPVNSDVFSLGSDHRSYQSTALKALRGTWPEHAFRVQPGMTLTLAAVYSVFGPHIRAAQFLQMVSGALMTVLVFDLARRVFDATTGWVAGLLWASFPLPIFYEAQLLTHGLEAHLGLLLLWLWLRAWQSRQARWLAALGLTLGVAAVLRPTFLTLAPLMAASLGWQRRARWPAAFGRTLALAAAVMLPIAPITWTNYRLGGGFQLISGNNDITLYLGNNRDSTGLGETSPAYQAAHTLVDRGETTYARQTLADIGDAPVRWLQLMARKVALYLGNPELPNNVDFYLEGTQRSPLLGTLPLRFGAMISLALAGAILALGDPRRRGPGAWVLLVYAATQLAVTVAYHVFSRFRAPVFPVLPIFGAWAVTDTYPRLRERRWREAGWHLVTVAFAGALIAAMPAAAERVMSRPILRALPPGTRTLDAPIGESLTLLGYDPPPAVRPGQPVFVTLYWQGRSPLAADLYGTVQVFVGPGPNEKIAQADQAIGTGGFPDYPTSLWRPGQIVRDRYLIQIPDDAPSPLALTLLVAAYDRASGLRAGETTFGPLALTRAEPLTLPDAAKPVGAKIGAATLAAYRAALDGDTLDLVLYWQAGDPMAEDGVVFVHLFDAAGLFIAGQDSRPRDGLYSTLAWQRGEGIEDEHRLPVPSGLPPGEYRISIGMYDAATQERLAVVDANGQALPDRALTLGTIER